MTDIAALKAKCARQRATAQLRPSRLSEVNRVDARLAAPTAKARYRVIEKTTGVLGSSSPLSTSARPIRNSPWDDAPHWNG